MKKLLVTIISLLLIATMLFGCGKKDDVGTKATEAPKAEDAQSMAPTDNRLTVQKFIDGILELLPDTQAVVDNFNKISFEKGVFAEIGGFKIMGNAMRLDVGYDVANETIGATLVQKNANGTESKVPFIFYKNECYADVGSKIIKVTPEQISTLLQAFTGKAIDLPTETIETEKIKNIYLALKSYDGDLTNDILKLVNEKFTWSESADEIKVVIAGESILAFKDALIDLVVNNAGVKDKITKEYIDEFIGDIDEDAVKTFGVITLTLELKDSKATALIANFLTSVQDEEDVNLSYFTQIDGSLTKIDGGLDVNVVEKTWKTNGIGEAYDRVQEVFADGEIKVNGNVITYNGIDYKLEATVGESDIAIKLLKSGTEKDENELNLDIVVKGLEEEIKVPEV